MGTFKNMWYDPGPNKIENSRPVSKEELIEKLQNLDSNKFGEALALRAKEVADLLKDKDS